MSRSDMGPEKRGEFRTGNPLVKERIDRRFTEISASVQMAGQLAITDPATAEDLRPGAEQPKDNVIQLPLRPSGPDTKGLAA